jgi:hypothetical protein
MRRRPSVRELRRQPLAALRAAPLQHQATAASGHTLAKTMLAFAFDVARLKCALHDRKSCFGKVEYGRLQPKCRNGAPVLDVAPKAATLYDALPRVKSRSRYE